MNKRLGLVAYTCNPSACEAEMGVGDSCDQQRGLISEFQTSLGYRVRPCLKQKQRTIEMEKIELLR